MSLTKRQKEILEFIIEYLAGHGYAPTLEEIAVRFGIASLNAVHKHLSSLQEKGYINRTWNRVRSIEVCKGLSSHRGVLHELPFLGYVAAGQPIEAVANVESVTVPDFLSTRGKNYVLRVKGDSMIEEHIEDGDYVVVEERVAANSGEMVIALLGGEYVTLKRYFREGSRIRLQPANPNFEPLLVEEENLKIQGVVIGIMRKYH
jgi:repressor LexA